jgi:hypothetical protein
MVGRLLEDGRMRLRLRLRLRFDRRLCVISVFLLCLLHFTIQRLTYGSMLLAIARRVWRCISTLEGDIEDHFRSLCTRREIPMQRVGPEQAQLVFVNTIYNKGISNTKHYHLH